MQKKSTERPKQKSTIQNMMCSCLFAGYKSCLLTTSRYFARWRGGGAPCCKHLWCYLLQIVVHSSPSAINFLHHQIATFHRGALVQVKRRVLSRVSKNVYSHLTVESGGQTQESNQEKQLSCFAISFSLS